MPGCSGSAGVAQRRGSREYLAGLLAPRERNKALTALAGAEPVTGSKLPALQRLQFFLSESAWDPEHSGDRKDGTKTAHVGRQWLGRYGKADNGVVMVTTVWADERVYYERVKL